MLHGMVKKIEEYTKDEITTMFHLMDTFYDNMKEEVFLHDFYAKDYCLCLYTEEDVLVGFTTQKVLELEIMEDGKPKKIHGVFSGDTIIHKDHWGDPTLFHVWANFWFPYGEQFDEFYWFLICKGYKTYRMLPLFWTEYYPAVGVETPERVKKIIDAYGKALYPEEYNPLTGVIEYKATKDKLKDGVADIGEKEKKRKEIAFFCEKNPGYIYGNDIACLALIDKQALKKRVRENLFHES